MNNPMERHTILKLLAITMIIFVVFAMSGCSTVAELERPEDATVIRASYTHASPISKYVTGSTDVCQITVLMPVSAPSETNLIDKYDVILDSEGCTVIPSNLEETP